MDDYLKNVKKALKDYMYNCMYSKGTGRSTRIVQNAVDYIIAHPDKNIIIVAPTLMQARNIIGYGIQEELDRRGVQYIANGSKIKIQQGKCFCEVLFKNVALMTKYNNGGYVKDTTGKYIPKKYEVFADHTAFDVEIMNCKNTLDSL